jgi:hypothetical protein
VGRTATNSCKRVAGEGTLHYGEGYCWWCEQEYETMYRGNGKKALMEMETALVESSPVELMGREVKIAEQQMEMHEALRRVKGQMQEMGELFEQVKELMREEKKNEALERIADEFKDMEFIDPEQGEKVLECVRAVTMGFTEKGQLGPVPISSDTKFQLLTKITEQVRKCAETASRIAKDHFDLGKANMIPMHVLKGHIPMFVGLVNKVAQDDQDRVDVGMKELRKIMLSIDQQAEEKR